MAISESKKLTQAQLERLALQPEFSWLFDPGDISVAAHKRAAHLANKDYLSIRESAD